MITSPIYDYWLGGKDNFAVDRIAAEQVIAAFPDIVRSARGNRAFLGRAVRHLVREAGVRQFLDIGTGLPAANNTHEVAQDAAPECRVAYVDNDPVVLSHAQALLASGPDGATAYIDADLRDPETILAAAAEVLDFSVRSRSCWWRSCSTSAIRTIRTGSWPSWRPVVVEYLAAGLTWGYDTDMLGTHVCRAGLPVAGHRAVLARAAGPVLIG